MTGLATARPPRRRPALRLSPPAALLTTLLSLVLPAAALAQGPLGAQGCDPGEREIRFAHAFVAEGHPIGDAAARLAQEVNRALDGRVCMTVFPNGALAGEAQALDALLRGEAEMAAPSMTAFERFTRSFEVFDLPFLFRDQEAVEWFQNSGPGQRLRRELNGTGLLGLSFWNAGMKQLAADRPLLAPQDAKGLTLRVRASAVLEDTIRRLGARPATAPLDRLRAALESGEVQGLEESWAALYAQRLYETLDGVTETDHGPQAYLVATSEAFWKGLPIRDRVDLKRILVAETARANARARTLAAQSREALQRAGVAIRALTPAQRQAWAAALRPVWSRFAPQIGEAYIEAAVTANR